MMRANDIESYGYRRRATGAAVLLVALMLAGSAPAGADQQCSRKPSPRDVSDRLAHEAAGESRHGRWLRAADLLTRSAELRRKCDPERMQILMAAAKHYRFGGDFSRASLVAYQAAEQGLRTGHVTEAAQAFIEAATFAIEARDPILAERAARSATFLAESPLLTPIQRIAIRSRAAELLGDLLRS